MHKNSCQSCRQRKLKCDRQQPCANCVTRSVECKQQLHPPASRGAKRRSEDRESDPSTLSDILVRLDRIEARINKSTRRNGNDNIVSTSIGAELNTIRDAVQIPASKTHPPLLGRSTQSSSSGDGLQGAKISANDNILRHTLMHNLSISISADPLTHQPTSSHHILLPPQHEIHRLCRVYFTYIGPFQNIIYSPHFLTLIDYVYHQIAHFSTTIAPRGLALILAVIAIAIVLEPLPGDLDAVLPVLKERLGRCAGYIRAAMDCLEQHRRGMDHSLDNVQAMLVLQFLIHHIEAFSPRSRALLAEAITVSHSLGLHLVDSPSARGRGAQEGADLVAQEVKRRVWWYLTATDWMISMAEGPFDVYLVQPQFTMTNIPLHINDADLDNASVKERPLSEPTTMSYFLHRLKVAEIARCISDERPHDPKDATCELVLSLDSKLESLIQSLPAFFRLEIADSDTNILMDQSHPYIPMQRLLINLMINLIRCKLHYPYLSGATLNQTLHEFSRKKGVKAARHVLSAHRDMSTADISHSADFMKIQGTLLHMFVGALVLATDLCCNEPRGGEERERQWEELTGALKRLEGMKRHSQVAAKFLRNLMGLLERCGFWGASASGVVYMEGESATGVEALRSSQMDGQEDDTPLAFDELWEAFVEQNSAVNMIDMS